MAALVLATAIVAAAVAVVSQEGAEQLQAAAVRPPATTSTTAAEGSTPSGSTSDANDVFDDSSVASYLETQADDSLDMTAAVYDDVTGQTWLYRPTIPLTTASIVKVDILETMLARAQQDGTALTPAQLSLAARMIEQSTDNAAQELWDTVGGATGVGHFDDEVGLTQTELNTTGYWGLSTTSALDQVRLLKELAFPNALLTDTSRDYEVGLMTHVTQEQTWGISAGVPSGVTVALKDGWDPITGVWEINSEGWVDGDGQDYVICILCWGAGSETAGIAAVDGLSSTIWAALASS